MLVFPPVNIGLDVFFVAINISDFCLVAEGGKG